MVERIALLSQSLHSGETTATALTQAYLAALEEKNGYLHAYMSVTAEKALQQAKAADRLLSRGEGGVLTGIPMALKDNLCSKGDLTTCASKILEGYRPCYDATAWAQLQAQGAVLLGKTNMDEFGMGSTGENSCTAPAVNPIDTRHVTGGSSSGSAAAVRAGLCAYALGSDTGGSVRLPAAYCGIVGLKPTYGAVSRYGLIAYASSLEQVGILAATVRDAATVFTAIAGQDPHDMTSAKTEYGNLTNSLETADLQGFRIGVPREGFDGVSGAVKTAAEKALSRYEAAGATLVEVSLPSLRQLLSVYYILACAEASSNLGRYDGIRYGRRADGNTAEEVMVNTRTQGFGDEVKRRLLLGTYVLSSGYYDAYYKKACVLREELCGAFDAVFASCDVLAMPTAPTVAPLLGSAPATVEERYLTDLLTVPANVAGLPALSLPVETEGLPVGLQLIGKRFDEKTVLQTAYCYEKHLAAQDSEGGAAP